MVRPTENVSVYGKCDDDVLDDLEKIADFASIDEMRFPLMDFLADEGEGARGVLAKMQFEFTAVHLGFDVLQDMQRIRVFFFLSKLVKIMTSHSNMSGYGGLPQLYTE